MRELALLEQSIEAAILAGVAWSPLSFGILNPRPGRLGDDNKIPADLLRKILMRCEENEYRDECGVDGVRGTQGSPVSSECGDPIGIIVARAGVKIDGARIEGYLDLSGLQFERPLIFSNCHFTHSVNLSNARLGAVSFDRRCVFENAPESTEEALSRYSARDKDGNVSERIGFLPPIMMVAQGINAAGATFDGYVDLTGLRAQRLDFIGAQFKESFDLKDADIELPNFFGKASFDCDEDALDCVLNLKAARGLHLSIEQATFVGKLDLTEARFESIYVTQSKLESHVKNYESRGVAITARALQVESDVLFRSGLNERTNSGFKQRSGFFGNVLATALRRLGHSLLGVQADKKKLSDRNSSSSDGLKQACIKGRIFFDSAKIGGSIKFEGVTIELGLSPKHLKLLAECEAVRGLSYAERLATRAISLRNCTVGGMVKLSKYEPRIGEIGHGELTGGNHRHALEQFFHCDGEIDLRSIVVEDDVRFERCHIENKSHRETAIDLRDAHIKHQLMFKGFSANSRGVIDLREAYAKSYRDDFEYVRGPALLNGVSLFRLLNQCWYAARDFLILMIGVALFLGTFGLLGRQFRRVERKSGFASDWPRQLKFSLSGFEYENFPIREGSNAVDSSDSSRMALTRGARLRWVKHQSKLWLTTKFQPQPWVQCAKVLGQLGYDRQSHALLMNRERHALHSVDVGVGEKLVRWFLILVCGQGHAMWRLVPIGAAVFCFALLVNTIAIHSNLMRPTNGMVLVSKQYREQGKLPADYSAVIPITFTLQSMFPLPASAGGSEWKACNRSQIRLSISQGSPGGCVPRSCSISEGRDCTKLAVAFGSSDATKNAKIREHLLNHDCGRQQTAGPNEISSVDDRAPVFADLICSSPEAIQSFLNSPFTQFLELCIGLLVNWYSFLNGLGTAVLNLFSGWTGFEFSAPRQTPFVLREFLTIEIANGLAARVNGFAGFVGWGIALIVGTYATGTLKRRE